MDASLSKRQFADEQANIGGWWWTTTGEIVRYVITAVIVLLFVVLISGSYCHARRRLKKGKEPLAYHKWLVSNKTRTRYGLQPIYPAGYYGPRFNNNVPAEQWSMNNWNYPPPPPAYNAAQQSPPDYLHPPQVESPYSKGEPHASVTVAPMGGESGQGYAPGPEYGAPPSQPPPIYR